MRDQDRIQETELDSSASNAEDALHRSATTTMQLAAALRSAHDRLAELEYENVRLQKLVAELLIKNQQLREGVRF